MVMKIVKLWKWFEEDVKAMLDFNKKNFSLFTKNLYT